MSAEIIFISEEKTYVGDIVTIESWNDGDRSWVGDPMEVVAIDHPFVCVKFLSNGMYKGHVKTFHKKHVSFKKLSEEFIKAIGLSRSSESP